MLAPTLNPLPAEVRVVEPPAEDPELVSGVDPAPTVPELLPVFVLEDPELEDPELEDPPNKLLRNPPSEKPPSELSAGAEEDWVEAD